MKMIALLRGVNVGGNRKISMPDLCALAAGVGLQSVCSYINSGNLVFDAGRKKQEAVGSLLENAIESQFGFHVDVVVRTASQWRHYSIDSPFSAAARDRPSLLHLGLAKGPFGSDTVTKLRERALHGEKIQIIGDAIWVDFTAGVGKSKLSPSVLDRIVGSPVTLRNWNTVVKLGEMAEN